MLGQADNAGGDPIVDAVTRADLGASKPACRPLTTHADKIADVTLRGDDTPAFAAQAFEAGFRAVFTNDVIVNQLPPPGVGRALLGCIGIYSGQSTRGEIADVLLNRPSRALSLPATPML